MRRRLLDLLYDSGETLMVYVKPKGCLLPEYLYKEERVALQIGWDLPLPVLNFRCTDAEFTCTLRFGTREQLVRVPLENITALEADDSLTLFATNEEPEPTVAMRRGLRVIQGGKSATISPEPKGAA